MRYVPILLCLLSWTAWGQQTAAEEHWAWFRTSSAGSPNGLVWFITEGKGTIRRSGNILSGQLFDGKDVGFVRHDFTGRIDGRNVTLLVVNNGTDASDEEFHGRLHRYCYDKHSGREHLMLNSSGPTFIGLVREIHGVFNCAVAP